ncbi:NAD(P)/FAD-dependent oxidoreductase [Limimaricola pyoseonensis]|uniref:Glycine oxidase n=1 Tax=Limimaricola pyoseonensis TaxID=521013 RepID=A0A1G7F4U8_9RHOB|nr:FAD-dependent oxidoreductase [Limimaricola pyoseonensis]SDE70872.1 glycine oxidase [Limimaricola pyoseonensis]
MASADLTVMGAGVWGLSVAVACARRGAHVRVIDPAGPAAGASGGVVGALAPHVPEQWNDKKAFQLEALLMAEEFWADIARLSGEDPGYARSGRLQPLADAEAVARAEARAEGAAGLWRGAAEWRVIAAEGLDAWSPGSPTGRLVHDTLSARLHPRRATKALARAFEVQGGEVEREGLPEGPVVWATGVAGLEELSAQAGKTVGNGVKGQAALLRPKEFDARARPQLFVDGLHVIPHADGTVGIGSTSERDYADGAATDDQLDALVARARRICPPLEDADLVERWAGLRPRAKSRAPMLGAHPFRANAYIANGGFKIGFGLAPLVGEVMADLVLEGRDRIPAAFQPEASL